MTFSFNFLQVTTATTGPTLNLINRCQSYGLIPKTMLCPSCCKPMNLAFWAAIADEYYWKCGNKIHPPQKKAIECERRLSLRLKTNFANSRLPICKIVLLICFWVDELENQVIGRYLQLTTKTVWSGQRNAVRWFTTIFSAIQKKLEGPE